VKLLHQLRYPLLCLPIQHQRRLLNLPERFELRILTGFLGAGKTTLLNEWLSSGQAEDVALLVNEFGAVAVRYRKIWLKR